MKTTRVIIVLVLLITLCNYCTDRSERSYKVNRVIKNNTSKTLSFIRDIDTIIVKKFEFFEKKTISNSNQIEQVVFSGDSIVIIFEDGKFLKYYKKIPVLINLKERNPTNIESFESSIQKDETIGTYTITEEDYLRAK